MKKRQGDARCDVIQPRKTLGIGRGGFFFFFTLGLYKASVTFPIVCLASPLLGEPCQSQNQPEFIALPWNQSISYLVYFFSYCLLFSPATLLVDLACSVHAVQMEMFLCGHSSPHIITVILSQLFIRPKSGQWASSLGSWLELLGSSIFHLK